MATVNLTYDTVKKTAKLTQDGKTVDFTSLEIFQDTEGSYKMNLGWGQMDDEHDIYESYRMACKRYDEQDIVAKAKESFKK